MSLEAVAAEAEACFARHFPGGAPSVLGHAPGRINLIGEHTDYLAGVALPAAIDRYVVMAARLREDRVVRLFSAAFDEEARLDLAALPARPTGWLAYVGGALGLFAAAEAKRGATLERGFDAVILGDVPLGGGMSSSAALECAVLNSLRALYGSPLGDFDLVRIAQQVEREVVGLQSGLLDQMACQYARAGQAMLIDFSDLRSRAIPAELPGWRWVLADTGVRRALAESAYDDRVASCREGMAALAAAGASWSVWDATVATVEKIGGDALWTRRLRHAITENARVLAAVVALEAGDAAALGALLNASHRSLCDDYAVSCPELDLLAETAWRLEGCAGARMMGGGFGGCTLNLVREAEIPRFRVAISEAFARSFGRPSPTWAVRLVDGAGIYRKP